MNLVKSIEQYNDQYIFLCEPIKNNIMSNSNFIRILYSAPNFVLNGIYLMFQLHDITCEKYYNKYKCNFNTTNHMTLINNLKNIEEEILKKYKTDKPPSFKIYEQLRSGCIKIFTDIENNNKQESSFILKISGIWETQQSYGLTFKFIFYY